MNATLVPAAKMPTCDQQTYLEILAEVEKRWHLCSYLPFVRDGALHCVCVGQKRLGDGFGVSDEYYYVFRAYSTTQEIEYESRHEVKAEAIAARFKAAEEHADLIYDNRKAR